MDEQRGVGPIMLVPFFTTTFRLAGAGIRSRKAHPLVGRATHRVLGLADQREVQASAVLVGIQKDAM